MQPEPHQRPKLKRLRVLHPDQQMLRQLYIRFVQEPLGEFLNSHFKTKAIILCTGAAIGFLNGIQAPITSFYDRYYLGWLIRLIHKPTNYFPRIIKSLNLIKFFY